MPRESNDVNITTVRRDFERVVDYFELKRQLINSVTFRLLRADNAAVVLTVLSVAFKDEHRPSVPEGKLRALLENLLDELRGSGDVTSTKSARDYLAEWADLEHGYLRRFLPPDADEPCFELTPETERAFLCLEVLRPRPHVGTESKFKRLVALLSEITDNSTSQPDVRIRKLQHEQARLQQQIDEIQRTGAVPTYSSTQINERFAAVLGIARELLGDFREVERHFRRVTEEIGIRQAEAGATRGGIVSQTLDAQDELRSSSQGQSFYAFWEFLLAPERRTELADLVRNAYELPELDSTFRNDSLLLKLQRHLRGEGAKVLESNERLVAQLRRILDSQRSAERKELGRLLQEIRHVAYQTRSLPAQTPLLEVDGAIHLSSVMSKAPWVPLRTVAFGGDLALAPQRDDGATELWKLFLQLEPIDFGRLRSNVSECLRSRVQITLHELLTLYPPRNGIIEVLAYMVIAATDGPHVIFDDADLLTLKETPGRAFMVPQVVFSNA